MGAASLRFGYLLGTPAITRDLGKIKLPYNVNAFTLIAAEVFIERWERIRTMVARIMEERERVRARMRDIPGIVVYPSAANFLLFETIAKTPGEVFQGVLKKGILIRDVSSYPQLGRGLRVTIGTPDENNSFLAALQEVMG
jgi:histidinol-phosphate/aromatic aminotransferase/cobyric acid decarboxylase-like protein